MQTHRNKPLHGQTRNHHLYRRVTLALSLLILICGIAHATTPDEAAIRGVLDAQVAAWNRADIPAFMQGYRNSPATTFVGKTIEHGYAEILARYQRTFTDKDKMGQLTFDDLDIHQLDANFAAVTGRFRLTRSPSAGGNATGIFSLIFEKTESGWKIILDHTA
ncbi:MAG TPA: nuclear transport factor 2 family protein [Acidobacteriaceae bacterium]